MILTEAAKKKIFFIETNNSLRKKTMINSLNYSSKRIWITVMTVLR